MNWTPQTERDVRELYQSLYVLYGMGNKTLRLMESRFQADYLASLARYGQERVEVPRLWFDLLGRGVVQGFVSRMKSMEDRMKDPIFDPFVRTPQNPEGYHAPEVIEALSIDPVTPSYWLRAMGYAVWMLQHERHVTLHVPAGFYYHALPPGMGEVDTLERAMIAWVKWASHELEVEQGRITVRPGVPLAELGPSRSRAIARVGARRPEFAEWILPYVHVQHFTSRDRPILVSELTGFDIRADPEARLFGASGEVAR